MSRRQIIWGLAFVVFISIFTYVILPFATDSGKILNSFAAKYLCSAMFVGHMDEDVAIKGVKFLPIEYLSIDVDHENMAVSSNFRGLASSTAYYYEKGKHCGCAIGGPPDLGAVSDTDDSSMTDSIYWPVGNRMKHDSMRSIGHLQIKSELDKITRENPNLLAVTVADSKGMLIESYGAGVTSKTRLLGWSMTKTLNAIVMGYLRNKEGLDISKKMGFPEWATDDRQDITWRHLLTMTSGISWEENYGRPSPVTRMLYLKEDMPAYVKRRELEGAPGQHWEYSSGSSNLISGAIRDRFGDKRYYRMLAQEVFGPIGVNSLNIEMDQAGHYVMSSYAWATARDWTRIGLLMLGRGLLGDVRVYDEQWADAMDDDVEIAGKGYGYQVWLNSRKEYKNLPDDAFFARGFGGQRVVIVPSLDLVITVLSGYEPDEIFDELFGRIIKAMS